MPTSALGKGVCVCVCYFLIFWDQLVAKQYRGQRRASPALNPRGELEGTALLPEVTLIPVIWGKNVNSTRIMEVGVERKSRCKGTTRGRQLYCKQLKSAKTTTGTQNVKVLL